MNAIPAAAELRAAPPNKTPLWQRCAGGGAVLLLLWLVLELDGRFEKPWLSVALVALLALRAATEFHALLAAGRFPSRPRLGLALTFALVGGKIAFLAQGSTGPLAEHLALALAVLLVLGVEVVRGEPRIGLERAAWTLLQVLYIVPFTLLLDILLVPAAPHGVQLALYVVLVAKSSDIGGYLAGSLFGGRKLVPKVSPGKTWSGAAGAVALSAAVAVAGGSLLDLELGWRFAAPFGAVLAVVALFGDLAESLLKRACNSKDAAALVPTFGGVLDMIDSLVFAVPVAYWWLARHSDVPWSMG